jgi:hypothetical protein
MDARSGGWPPWRSVASQAGRVALDGAGWLAQGGDPIVLGGWGNYKY